VLDLPALPTTATAPSLQGGAPVSEFLALDRDEQVLALTGLGADSPGLVLGTAAGMVKRVLPDTPTGKDVWDVIRLAAGDTVVGATQEHADDTELCLVSTDAQLLHFPLTAVRPQGRGGGGITGMKLSGGARVVFFGAVAPDEHAVVATVAGSGTALPGTETGSAKVTPLAEYPGKGRATGGVRCHRFLRGESALLLAWVGGAPALGAASSGAPVDLPPAEGRRDGSGTPLDQPVTALGGPLGR
jgi:DNA gyrase subunit A